MPPAPSAPPSNPVIDALNAVNPFARLMPGYQAPQTPADKAMADINARQAKHDADLQAYFEEMNKPLDPNDPYVKALTNLAANTAGTNATNRGIQGPMAVNATQQAVIQQGTMLDMQRKQMASQALGMGGQDLNNARGFALDALNRQYQQNAGMGQTIGSTLGAVAGGVGGSFVGMPAQGAMLGSQLGGGIGGQIGGSAGGGYGYGYGGGAPPGPPSTGRY